jgi:multidrug resistance efflux pump
MRKLIIYSAIFLLALSTAAHAHEPIGLRFIREYHQKNARVQAEKERQRKQWEQWEKDWQRQEQMRRQGLTPKRT